jgi:hypothetical protein
MISKMMKLSALPLIALLAADLPGITPAHADEPVAGTYSIVACSIGRRRNAAAMGLSNLIYKTSPATNRSCG